MHRHHNPTGHDHGHHFQPAADHDHDAHHHHGDDGSTLHHQHDATPDHRHVVSSYYDVINDIDIQPANLFIHFGPADHNHNDEAARRRTTRIIDRLVGSIDLTEHVHDWRINDSTAGADFVCDCGAFHNGDYIIEAESSAAS